MRHDDRRGIMAALLAKSYSGKGVRNILGATFLRVMEENENGARRLQGK